MKNIFAKIQRPSLRWGLIFGIILGIALMAFDFAVSFVSDQSSLGLLGYIPALLFIVLGFYAGLRASQETGKWVSGLVAGIWVGVIGAAIAELLPVIITLINLQSFLDNLNKVNHAKYTTSDVEAFLAENALAGIISSTLYTAIGGALGGFIGRRRALAAASKATTAAYEEAMFEPPTDQTNDKAPEPTTDSVPETPAELTDTEVKDEAAK